MAVAALTAWHVAHESARRAAADAVLPAHARVETYSVLTRIPPPHRLAPAFVAELLERRFPAADTVAPSAALSRELVGRCGEHGVAGGAVYDALVGLTAREADILLLTRDERAARTYERVGVPFRLMR